MLELKFARLREGAVIPSKRKEDAGYDIYPCINKDIPYLPINPHCTMLIPTGIASVIPEGYYMQIEERGSTGSKGIKKSAGVIDSGYRGEWFIAITNANNVPIYIENVPGSAKGLEGIAYPAEKAIAQAVLHRVIEAEVTEITPEQLKDHSSERGDGALGSSRK